MSIETRNSLPAAHRPPSPAVQQLPAAPGAQRLLRHVALPHRQPAHDTRASARQEVSTNIQEDIEFLVESSLEFWKAKMPSLARKCSLLN